MMLAVPGAAIDGVAHAVTRSFPSSGWGYARDGGGAAPGGRCQQTLIRHFWLFTLQLFDYHSLTPLLVLFVSSNIYIFSHNPIYQAMVTYPLLYRGVGNHPYT